MSDPTETARCAELARINEHPATREELVERYGADNVWDTSELSRDFTVHGFLAPYCVVTRKRDGVKGSLVFQHHPRFYFGFQPA